MSQGCALLILGSKGQRSRSWRMVIWKWSTEIMVADLNLLGSVGDLYCFSNTFSMLLYVAPICCPWLFENGFRTITDSVINLWSWNFIHLLPMSQGCALLILGSKGQRSRSWRMVIWKWSTEIMVADLNLLGSVGDLYCFSNTFSTLTRAHESKDPVPYCDHALSGVRQKSVKVVKSVRGPLNYGYIFDFWSRTAWWILMKLGMHEVLKVPYKCCCFSARSVQGRILYWAKIGHGGTLL